MKVLLTGARGQVGVALANLAPPDVELIALTHDQLDIGDDARVRACMSEMRPDVVINAGAYTAVDRAESEPDLARAANERGPVNLAQAVARNDARIIHISTDYVFDGESSRPWRPDHPTHPLSVYGRTKLAGEQAVRSHCPERSVVLRTAWIYSAHGHNFVRTMLRLMKERGAVRVVSDQIGTPTAAESVAQAIWRIVQLPGLQGIYHWTDAGVATWYDFAVAIAEEAVALGKLPKAVEVIPISTQDYPTPARRPHFSVLDIQETVASTGLVPCHWRVNLRRVLGGMHLA